ncbi:MAG: hypothetical protein ISS28_07440 [Candidatus Cloacimonetes bacterium]|nr:hypothetical protein [Candidatus Cloacimonadota bacterium]
MNEEYLKLRNYSNFSFTFNKQLIEAIKHFFKRYDYNISEKNSIDYQLLKKQYLNLISGRKIDDLTIEELNIAQPLEMKMFEYKECDKELETIKYNLKAVFFLVSQFDRNKILKYLNDKPYLYKHEILTRWMWISEQHSNIIKEKSHNFPYLCEVGSNVHRKTLDREFHTYLIFMEFFSRENNSEFLLLEKTKCQDFLIIDSNDKVFGLEITEALPIKEVMIERKAFDKISDKLNKDFSQRCISISVQTRPNYSSLLESYSELKEWIGQALLNDQLESTIQNDQLETSIYIYKQGNGFDLFDVSNSPVFVNRTVSDVTKHLLCAIRKKLKKNYQKPCILAVYENTGCSTMKIDEVIRLCKEDDIIKNQDVFNQIWVVTENKSYLIYKNAL